MAILSDTTVKKLIKSGDIPITALQERIGPASYDLSIGDIHLLDLYRGSARRVDDRVIRNGGYYFADSKESFSLPEKLRQTVTTRSSLARCGLKVTHFGDSEISSYVDVGKLPHDKNKIPLVLTAHKTNVHLPPSYPPCQLVIYEEGTNPLTQDELEKAVRNGEVRVIGEDGNPVKPRDGKFELSFGRQIKKFTGDFYHIISPDSDINDLFMPFDMQDFENAVTDGYVPPTRHSFGFPIYATHFYLGQTREKVNIGPKNVGALIDYYEHLPPTILDNKFENRKELKLNAYTNLNAPYLWPGSSGNQVLEIASVFLGYSGVRLPRLSVGDHACDLVIFPLTEEPERTYGRRKSDKYHGQTVPLYRGHTDFL